LNREHIIYGNAKSNNLPVGTYPWAAGLLKRRTCSHLFAFPFFDKLLFPLFNEISQCYNVFGLCFEKSGNKRKKNLENYLIIYNIRRNSMEKSVSIEKLIEYLSYFSKMYDRVRLVDPLEKKVLYYSGEELRKEVIPCYAFWNKSVFCDNCVSIRSYRENQSYIKLENSLDRIYMLTTIPVDNSDRPVVVECMKDVTDSMFIAEEGKLSETLHSTICQLNDLVIKDSLTGLYNRRYVEDRLPVDILRSKTKSYPLTLIFLDIDGFKDFNDKHGHLTGDHVLRSVGEAIRSTILLNTDWASRYGGDEFLICLNRVDYEEGCHIAERIRSAVERIALSGTDIRVTASLGVLTVSDLDMTAEEMIKNVDEKLYIAKDQGRNRIVGEKMV
jgi:two-component system cell cycle response regulator